MIADKRRYEEAKKLMENEAEASVYRGTEHARQVIALTEHIRARLESLKGESQATLTQALAESNKLNTWIAGIV